MGNVMCCCRGRDKIEENKTEENSSIQTGLLKKSNEENHTPQLSKAEARVSIAGAQSSDIKDLQNQNNVKSMGDFSTFGGGDKLDIYEDEFSLKNKKKIVQPSQYKSFDTFSDETRFEMMNKKIFIRLYLDYLEVNYKFCDDYGLVFKPFLEISIEGLDDTKVLPQSNFDGELEKSLNFSNISGVSDNETSFNMSQNAKTTNSFFFSNLKEKNFHLKFSKVYEIPMIYLYSNIKFVIKNELPIKQSNIKENMNLPPSVIIAEASIPINILYKEYKESHFEGCIEMKLRESSLVGYLKTIVNISENSLVGQEEFIDKMQKAKFLDVSQDEAQKLDNLSVQSNTKIPLWIHNYLDYKDLNPDSVAAYFTDGKAISHDLPTKIMQLKCSQSHDVRDIYNFYHEIQNCNNNLAIYQFLVFLVKLTKQDYFTPVSEFFNLLNEKEISYFFGLPQSIQENSYIFKMYLIFIHNYLKYFKSIKSPIMKKNKFHIEYSVVIKNVFELLLKIIDRLKNNKSSISPHYNEEIRSCVLWILNILNEVISETGELSGKNEEVLEYKKKEYTTIYDNCIQIVSNRVYLMRIYDTYMNDSQIMSSVFRLFRKTTQVLTNDTNSLLDLKKLNMHPKEFSANLKKIIIEQNDGIFFVTLKLILMKYQHYPEMHRNILIIIYQLTNFCDSQSLIWAAEKLNLLVFSNVFEIYRGRMKNFNKVLNNLHLNILSNFSEIITETNYYQYEDLSNLISKDIKAYYKNTPNFKRRFDDFQQRKYYEIEIHEIITRIGQNITRSENSCKNLMNSLFFEDIIQFLIVIANCQSKDDSQVSEGSNYGPDFILRVMEKKKKTNIEKIKKIVASILNYSIDIINNVLTCSDEVYENFSAKLSECDLSSSDEVVVVLDKGRDLLVKYGMKVDIFEEKVDKFKNFFQSD